MGSPPSPAREAAAKLCGVAAAGIGAPQAAALLADLTALVTPPPPEGPKGPKTVATKPGGGGGGGENGVVQKMSRARFEERDGATAAAGYVLAQAMTGARTCGAV